MDNIPDADDPIPNIDDDSGRFGELVRFLTDNQDMRKTAKSSLKQAMWAGGGAFAGSFLGGPIVGLVGGICGSIVGYMKSDDYDGAVLAVMKLDNVHREALMTEVGQVLMAAGAVAQQLQTAEAFHQALTHFAQQDAVRDGIWSACVQAIRA